MTEQRRRLASVERMDPREVRTRPRTRARTRARIRVIEPGMPVVLPEPGRRVSNNKDRFCLIAALMHRACPTRIR